MENIKKHIKDYKKAQKIFLVLALLAFIIGIFNVYPEFKKESIEDLRNVSQIYDNIKLTDVTTDLEKKMQTYIIEFYEIIIDLKKGYNTYFGILILILFLGMTFFIMLNAINCHGFIRLLKKIDKDKSPPNP